jgi:hypothetical protein
MANREVLPRNCPLPENDKTVINNTAFDEEMPCFGCPRRSGCLARLDLDFATALILMAEKAPPTRTCRRCNGFITEWRVSGSFRNFTCLNVEAGFPCGWNLSELGDQNYLT